MGNTFLLMLPLALAAAVNPTGLVIVIMILAGKGNARRNALSFAIGGIVFLVVLAVAIMLLYKPALSTANNPDLASGIIDVGLAVLILAFLVRMIVVARRPKKEKPKEPKPDRKRPYPVLGFLYMAINASSLVPFIAAVKVIADGGLSFIENLPLFIVLITLTMAMFLFPVVLTYLMPERSQKLLGSVNGFMSRHGQTIAEVFFLLIAIYLAVKGINTIVKS